MRAMIPLMAGVLMICGAGAAFAQFGGTGRPSYDMPRAYDRDAQGNETYRYHSSPDQMGRTIHHGKKKKRHRKHRY